MRLQHVTASACFGCVVDWLRWLVVVFVAPTARHRTHNTEQTQHTSNTSTATNLDALGDHVVEHVHGRLRNVGVWRECAQAATPVCLGLEGGGKNGHHNLCWPAIDAYSLANHLPLAALGERADERAVRDHVAPQPRRRHAPLLLLLFWFGLVCWFVSVRDIQRVRQSARRSHNPSAHKNKKQTHWKIASAASHWPPRSHALIAALVSVVSGATPSAEGSSWKSSSALAHAPSRERPLRILVRPVFFCLGEGGVVLFCVVVGALCARSAAGERRATLQKTSTWQARLEGAGDEHGAHLAAHGARGVERRRQAFAFCLFVVCVVCF